MTERREFEDPEKLLGAQDPQAPVEEMPYMGEVKIPAVKLFEELGKHFDREL